jgi:hypothetical protein
VYGIVVEVPDSVFSGLDLALHNAHFENKNIDLVPRDAFLCGMTSFTPPHINPPPFNIDRKHRRPLGSSQHRYFLKSETMARSILSSGLLLAASSILLSADGAVFQRNSLSTRNVFGLSTTIPNIPRGGAELFGEEEEKEPEVLYLPGLLDAELSKSDHVRQLQRKYCVEKNLSSGNSHSFSLPSSSQLPSPIRL